MGRGDFSKSYDLWWPLLRLVRALAIDRVGYNDLFGQVLRFLREAMRGELKRIILK